MDTRTAESNSSAFLFKFIPTLPEVCLQRANTKSGPAPCPKRYLEMFFRAVFLLYTFIMGSVSVIGTLLLYRFILALDVTGYLLR
jgi:hypothetical protein